MKAYVTVTGTVFALLAVVHVWRVVVEGSQMTRDPFFMGVTVLAVAFSAWAWRVFRQLPR